MAGYYAGWGDQASTWYLEGHDGVSYQVPGDDVQRRRMNYRPGQSINEQSGIYGYNQFESLYPYYNPGENFSGYYSADTWSHVRPNHAPWGTFALGVHGYEDDRSWFNGWQPGNGMYDGRDNPWNPWL